MSIYKKIASYLALIFALVLIIGFFKDAWWLMHADERLKEAEDKLAEVKIENKKLQKKLEYYQSDEFLEEQVRNKLQMAKPGETVLILPEEINQGTSLLATSSASVAPSEEEKEDLANWKKWFKLFWQR